MDGSSRENRGTFALAPIQASIEYRVSRVALVKSSRVSLLSFSRALRRSAAVAYGDGCLPHLQNGDANDSEDRPPPYAYYVPLLLHDQSRTTRIR